MKIKVTRRMQVRATFKPDKIMADWQGRVLSCGTCHCSFELESNDEPKIFAQLEEWDCGNMGVNDAITYFVFCPEGCGGLVEVGTRPILNISDYSKHVTRGTSGNPI